MAKLEEKKCHAVSPLTPFRSFQGLRELAADLQVKGVVDDPAGLCVVNQISSEDIGITRTLYTLNMVGVGLVGFWETIVRNADGTFAINVAPVVLPKTKLVFAGDTGRITKAE